MAKKYISKYSNGKEITAAQYITEIICEHWAKQNQKDLHYRFWSTSEQWQKHYKNQITSANKLLKKYSDKAIIKALNDSKAYKIYSLRDPFLLPIIEYYEKQLQENTESLTKEFVRKEQVKFSNKKSGKKNIISRLKDLDNE